MSGDRLRRCRQCGELRGRGRFSSAADPTPEWVELSCLCDGIVCRCCRKNAIRRPISNHFDDATRSVWHVPWFAAMIPCADCR